MTIDAVPTVDAVPAVRRFSRFYTNRIGALRAGLLDTPWSLTEVRVMYELAQTDLAETVELRRRLDLDAGYLSRIVRRLESEGLAERERSSTDARRQRVRLTTAGRAYFAQLDARSTEQIRALLTGVTEPDRRRLVAALATVEEILGAPPGGSDERSGERPGEHGGRRPTTVVLRPPAPGDLGWVVQRHGAVYAAEYGWDHTFEAYVARIVADYADSHDPRREDAWIAEIDGVPVGSIFCVRLDDTTAQLRLLLVEAHARGAGVGARLVEECLRFARRAGYREIMLLTVDVLAGARRVYERAGFTLVSEERQESFGTDLVHQRWSRPL